MPDWYHCNSKNCKLPSCECARTRPPGGLAPADIPQFVLVRGRVGGRRGGVQQVPARPLFAGQPAGQAGRVFPPPPPQTWVQLGNANALESTVFSLINGMIDGRTNHNGCPVPTTYFAMRYHSQCQTGVEAWKGFNEIAMQVRGARAVLPPAAHAPPTHRPRALARRPTALCPWWGAAPMTPTQITTTAGPWSAR